MKIDLSHTEDTVTFKKHIVQSIKDDAIPVSGPVDVQVTVMKSGSTVVVKGGLRVSLSCECSRCLKTCTAIIDSPFDAQYEIDLSNEIQEIDISEDIRQSIILALPAKPLCREDCPGLCPQCGKDLSKGNCACTEVHPDDRMSKLKKFKFNS